MPMIKASCPHCGKEASEYELGKWKCLYCGRKFIHETPGVTVNNFYGDASEYEDSPINLWLLWGQRIPLKNRWWLVVYWACIGIIVAMVLTSVIIISCHP